MVVHYCKTKITRLCLCRPRWKVWRWSDGITGRILWRRMRQVLAMYKVTRRKSNLIDRRKKLICFCKCESLLSQKIPHMLISLFGNNQRQMPTRTRCNLRFLLFAWGQILALNQTSFYGLWTHFNVFKSIFCPYDEDFDIVLTLK